MALVSITIAMETRPLQKLLMCNLNEQEKRSVLTTQSVNSFEWLSKINSESESTIVKVHTEVSALPAGCSMASVDDPPPPTLVPMKFDLTAEKKLY